MGTKKVNDGARQIIEKVREEFGYTFAEMSDLCGVAVGSVQRWYSTGRARGDKIKHLEDLLTNVRLPETKITENLIEIYWYRKGPCYLTLSQLKKMAGRARLSPKIIENIQTELDYQGFLFVEEMDDDERTIYILLRRKWCRKKSKMLDEKFLKNYYSFKVESELEEEY